MQSSTKISSSSMKKLLSLLDDIAGTLIIDSEDDISNYLDKIENYYNEFLIVYEDASFRHSYADISRHLSIYGEDLRDYLPTSLSAIVQYSETIRDKPKASEEVKRVHRSLCKLLDHVELECIRLNRMDTVKHYTEDAKDIAQEARKLNSVAEESAKEAQKNVSNIHEQSITILGIFSAVIIGFVAELSLFVKGFENLTRCNFSTILLYSSFVGMLVFDTLFMLMFAIAKISGTSIGVRCRHEHCSNCTRRKFWPTRMHCKYPYVIYFNLLCIVVSIFLYVQIKP